LTTEGREGINFNLSFPNLSWQIQIKGVQAMNFSFISGENWNKFAAEYPQAYMFLIHAANQGEIDYLRRLGCKDMLNDHEKKRLADFIELGLA
jgi:hypothetical protein